MTVAQLLRSNRARFGREWKVHWVRRVRAAGVDARLVRVDQTLFGIFDPALKLFAVVPGRRKPRALMVTCGAPSMRLFTHWEKDFEAMLLSVDLSPPRP
jgi:hypothetical protein